MVIAPQAGQKIFQAKNNSGLIYALFEIEASASKQFFHSYWYLTENDEFVTQGFRVSLTGDIIPMAVNLRYTIIDLLIKAVNFLISS